MQRQQSLPMQQVALTVPVGFFSGQQLTVQVNNTTLMVVIPPGVIEGQQFMIQVPQMVPQQMVVPAQMVVPQQMVVPNNKIVPVLTTQAA